MTTESGVTTRAGLVEPRPKRAEASDRRRRLMGAGFFIVAALITPLASVAAVASGRGLSRALAETPERMVRSAIHRLAGDALEARGLELVEGHAPLIRAAAEEFQVPPCLLGGVMFAESRGRGGQTSSRGALGLMQLVVPAARDAGKRAGIELPEDREALVQRLLEDDGLNVRLGAAHLHWLLDHRGEWSDEAVLVSYNAGRSRLFQWIERDGGYAAWVQGEEARAARGERTSGALAYARQVLAAARALEARGQL